jgi:hypothetical protein
MDDMLCSWVFANSIVDVILMLGMMPSEHMNIDDSLNLTLSVSPSVEIIFCPVKSN